MNDEIEKIKSRIKNKRNTSFSDTPNDKNKDYLKNLFSRTLITIILVLISAIYINHSNDNLLKYKDLVFTKNISFAPIKNWYEKSFGKIIPIEIEDENTQTVFSDDIIYTAIEDYYDGHKLTVSNNTIINTLTSGIIVYIGEKENYGNVVIVQGIDGVDIWYGNVSSADLTLYDYIEEGSILGESKGDYIYFVLTKDGEYLDYEEYITENKN